MDVIDNTPEPNSTELVGSFSNYGSSNPQPSREIAAEDQHYSDAILRMDPVSDVPGVAVFPEGMQLSAPTLAALAPDDRMAVRAKMDEARLTPAQREQREGEFVQAHLRSQLSRIRLKTGVGEDATPYHRAQCHMAREYFDIMDEHDRYAAQLDEIARHETEVDPLSGEARAVPVYAVQGSRRNAYQFQMDNLLRRAGLLFNADGTPGLEGSKRLREASAQSVAILRDRDSAAEERAEAKRRGAELAREERISKQAASIARMSRNGR